MPLTAKGTEIMAGLVKEYGAEKGKSVFYAGKNSGKFTGVDENCTADEKLDEIACRADALGERLAALEFEQPAQSIKDSFTADDLKKLNDVLTSGPPARSSMDPRGDSMARDDAQALVDIAKRNGVKISVY